MQPTPHDARANLPLKDHVLTFVGAFSIRPRELARLKSAPEWRPWALTDALPEGACAYMRAQSVPTFHALMFDAEAQPEIARFERRFQTGGVSLETVPSRGGPVVAFSVVSARVYAFSKKMGRMALFAVEVRLAGPSPTLGALTLLGAHLRELSAAVSDGAGATLTVEDLFEKTILPDVTIRREDDPTRDPLEASRLKTFVVADLGAAQAPETLRELLYDVASLVPPGSAGGETHFTPTPHYLEQLVSPAVRPFRNWQAVTFLDTFAAVGHDLLERERRTSWTESYLALYIFNLYIKFRCHQLTADVYDTASRNRNAAVLFLSRFALERVSTNFLPSLLHDDLRRGLELRRELKALKRHIESLSRLVVEDGQTRQNALLALVSVFGAAEGIPAILDAIPEVEDAVGMHGALFWVSLAAVALTLGALVFWFLLPAHARHVSRLVRDASRRRRARRKATLKRENRAPAA
jgi:hypothetical protein